MAALVLSVKHNLKMSRFALSNLILRRIAANQIRCFSDGTKPTFPENALGDKFSAVHQPTNGEIYDKKPFKLKLTAGKSYSWCLCGKSHSQPLCDGTHKNIYLKIKHRPIRFVVEETKEYWLCNCKQTKRRPFCDGTHKDPVIQETNVKV